jgi:hypothetical protein
VTHQFDVVLLNVAEQRGRLIGLESNEGSPMSCSIPSRAIDLIQDELESK